MSEIYGPNTAKVELFLDRIRKLTPEEVVTVSARRAIPSAARNEARHEVWSATRDAAWDDAWDEAARDEAWDATWIAAWDAARDAARSAALYEVWYAALDTVTTLVVMDLITKERFAILTEPFAEILVELGITWEGK